MHSTVQESLLADFYLSSCRIWMLHNVRNYFLPGQPHDLEVYILFLTHFVIIINHDGKSVGSFPEQQLVIEPRSTVSVAKHTASSRMKKRT